jgi:outer membrane protein assembly factor BamE
MRFKIVLLTLLLASCDSFYIPLLTPYKMDIRQGNFVSFDMREKLKVGMTKDQVRYVMGTPMISDPFHADRWDYVYRFQHDSKITEKQNLTLYFEGDNLARIVDGSQRAETAPANLDNQGKSQGKG